MMVVWYMIYMTRGIPELKDEREIKLIEGKKEYLLKETVFKSRIVIEDTEGNRVAIDKRDGWIKVERRGNVDWHREES